LADPLHETTKLLLASGNDGKLKEFRVLAEGHALDMELVPNFSTLPKFVETAPTFAENATGKALYYSRHVGQPVFADDSGLVVDALGGAPGVLSARYAGPGASDAQKIAKLFQELRATKDPERSARFVCVIAVAFRGRARVVVSGEVNGLILEETRGNAGFGYDPVFYFPPLQKTFAELLPEEKNRHSHRGKAFRRMMEVLE
jgi:XTP/dITP diphosphohydrolase